MEIIIIGTDPPCPRCREMYERVKTVAKELASQPSIRKIVYSSQEAQHFGKMGTGHDVAEWSGVQVDWDRIQELAGGDWTPELDQLLMPLKAIAMKEGWIVTPVVVIDGQVVHFGNVPGMDDLRLLLIVKIEDR